MQNVLIDGQELLFSEFATERATDEQLHTFEYSKPSADHTYISQSQNIYDQLLINYEYNELNFQSQPLPKFWNVIVVGAGPSLNEDSLKKIEWSKYDAILLTLPIVKHFSYLLDSNNVYVVDAEADKFVALHYYGQEMFEKIRLVCHWYKYLEKDWNFKSLHFFEDDHESIEYPLSTGALALKVAFDGIQSENVEIIGIDCTGHHQKYLAETSKILNVNAGRWTFLGKGGGL